MKRQLAALAVMFVALVACTDTPTATRTNVGPAPTVNTLTTALGGPSTSSVRWNRIAIALFRNRGNPNAGRTAAYLTLAQYRAVLAAQNARHDEVRPSLAGAAAGAAVVVLEQFYPLAAQRAESPRGAEINEDFAEGEAIGRQVAATVLRFATFDNFGVTS